MTEHTDRLFVGLGIFMIIGAVIGAFYAVKVLIDLAAQYWPWGVLALGIAFVAYLLGWVLEVTTGGR